MGENTTRKPYPAELRERAVRMVVSRRASKPLGGRRSLRSPASSVATLRHFVAGCARPSVMGGRCWHDRLGAGAPQGAGVGEKRVPASERDPAQGISVFCPGGTRPPIQVMIAFIDDHREVDGVEPICRQLPIAPSTYHAHTVRRADPSIAPARLQRDARRRTEIRRVWDENFQVYGVRKVWHQLRREGFKIARCTVARLMQEMDMQGAVRGKVKRTTVSDKSKPCPLDHVNRDFQPARPNVSWVSDFTYVATWHGFACVAFVIDAFARRIVGWRASGVHSTLLGIFRPALTNGSTGSTTDASWNHSATSRRLRRKRNFSSSTIKPPWRLDRPKPTASEEAGTLHKRYPRPTRATAPSDSRYLCYRTSGHGSHRSPVLWRVAVH